MPEKLQKLLEKKEVIAQYLVISLVEIEDAIQITEENHCHCLP